MLKNLSIYAKISIPLALIGISIILLTLSLNHYLSYKETNELLINVSGKNRMLTQRIVYYSNEISRGKTEYKINLSITISKYQENLNLLKNGGKFKLENKIYNLRKANNNQLKKIHEIELIWIKLKNNAVSIADYINYDYTSNHKSLDIIEQNSEILLTLNNELVNLFLIDSYNKKASIKTTIYLTLGIIFILIIIIILINNNNIKRLSSFKEKVNSISKGKIPEEINTTLLDEIGKLSNIFNKVIINLRTSIKFSKQISEGKYDTKYIAKEGDAISNYLIKMQSRLIKTDEKVLIRDKDDEIKNWIANGNVLFGDILRDSNIDFKEYTYKLLYALIEYLNCIQGGFYFYEKDEDGEYLNLVSSFAYDRKKHSDKKIYKNEDLIWAIFQEKEISYLTNIPNDYLNITSGLGDESPSNLIIIPLISEKEAYGIIEIAGFNKLEDYQIDFVKKLASNIGSMLEHIKYVKQTEILLEKAQSQAEELKEKEESMRSNIDELQELQEETSKKEIEWRGLLTAINNIIMELELTKDGIITFANNRFCELAGHTNDKIKNTNALNLFVNINETINPISKKDFLSDKIYKGVAKIYNQTKDNYIWAIISCTPVYDNNNNIIKRLFLANDISEQKRMEIEIKNSEENLKIELNRVQDELKEQFKEIETEKVRNELILEGMLDAILSVNSKGIITFFNKAAEDIWGYSKEDLIGQNVSKLFSKETIETDDFVSNLVDINKDTYVSVRQEVNILNKWEEESSVLILVSEADLNGEKTYTAFVQNIEMELF